MSIYQFRKCVSICRYILHALRFEYNWLLHDSHSQRMFDGDANSDAATFISSGIVKWFWWIIVVSIRANHNQYIHVKYDRKSHEQTVNTESIHILMNSSFSFVLLISMHFLLNCWFDSNKISAIRSWLAHCCVCSKKWYNCAKFQNERSASNRRLIHHYGNYTDFRIQCTHIWIIKCRQCCHSHRRAAAALVVLHLIWSLSISKIIPLRIIKEMACVCMSKCSGCLFLAKTTARPHSVSIISATQSFWFDNDVIVFRSQVENT